MDHAIRKALRVLTTLAVAPLAVLPSRSARAQQPVAAQPVAGQPVAAQPVAGQPVAATAQPVAAQPVAQQPTAQEPVADQGGNRKQITLAPAFTSNRASVAVGIRYGTNDLNAGAGLHAGYTLDIPIYIGGAFDYWFGSSETVASPAGEITAESSGWNVFGLVGYDLGITRTFVIRPYGGLGIFAARAEVCTSSPVSPVEQCIEASASDAAGAFGGQLMVLLGSLHLGGELRVIFAEEAALIVGGNVGLVL